MCERLSPSLELVSLAAGKLLHGAGHGFESIYFPTQTVISLQYAMKNGDTSEVGCIGYESACGVLMLMGGETAPYRAVVRHPGYAFRIRANALQREFDLGGPFKVLMMRCAQSLLCQAAQTALCNRHHRVEQQLCRWLLMSLDRLPGSEILVTHELIAGALGVRRESITQAILRLKTHGCITSGRSSITALDRASLEARSCECYSAVKREGDRLAPDRRVAHSHEGRPVRSAPERSYTD